MPSPRNIAVNIGNGLIVWHTAEEWARYTAGVDKDAARQMRAKLDPKELARWC